MSENYKEYTLGYQRGERKEAFNEKKIYELKENEQSLDFLRKATGYTLTISQQTIPVAGFVREADVTKLWEVYEKLSADTSRPIKITFNTLMLRLFAECLKSAPILNAHLKYKPFNATGTLTYKGSIEVSMPVILPNGRMIPLVLHDAGNKTLDEMAFAVSEIERKSYNTILDETLYDVAKQRMFLLVRQGHALQAIATGISSFIGKHKVKFAPPKVRREYRKAVKPEDRLCAEDIGEGTVCISDLGSIYSGKGFATTSPVLQPTTAVIAFGRVLDEEKVYKKEDGQLDLKTVKTLPITILFDHKIGGFPDIVPFLNKMDEFIGNPEQILNW
ncbi:MAG: 2-oxo acid dehydrogenase subunit E2 [Ruminococcaceae bacterium]|jgi:pyruvate/2-oxoglutarate dehydrogenase complex dihydrolipoamide acyltransferase (E2) component|nr:2-oxo acid dehydrogenase subunit E2 [Oscillospiraceae bacterium]